jgi:hypothetical protein
MASFVNPRPHKLALFSVFLYLLARSASPGRVRRRPLRPLARQDHPGLRFAAIHAIATRTAPLSETERPMWSVHAVNVLEPVF